MSNEYSAASQETTMAGDSNVDERTRRLSPFFMTLVSTVLIGVALVIISWAAPVVAPVALAAYLATLCWPLYGWLETKGLSHGLALVVMVMVVVAGVGGLLLLLFLSAHQLRSGLAAYQDGLSSGLASIANPTAEISAMVDTALGSLSGESLTAFLDSFLGNVIDAVANGLFALVLVVFFLIESNRFSNLMATGLRNAPVMISQLPHIAKAAIQYFLVRIQINLLTAVLVGVALLLLGIDNALLWAILTFFLSFVPYIGLTVAMIPPILLALAEFGAARALVVIIGTVVINLAIENIVEPALTGKQLKLSPTAVFISFFFWGWLLGPVGVFLSMPITVLLLVMLDS